MKDKGATETNQVFQAHVNCFKAAAAFGRLFITGFYIFEDSETKTFMNYEIVALLDLKLLT